MWNINKFIYVQGHDQMTSGVKLGDLQQLITLYWIQSLAIQPLYSKLL